jgi:micrococcal nuclease
MRMKAFAKFWKKDIINKLIVIVSLAVISGVFIVAYLLLNLKSDSIFYTVFVPKTGGDGIPTLAVEPTSNSTPTEFVFAQFTAIPTRGSVEQPLATELPTIIVETPPTATPEPPTASPTSPLPTSTVVVTAGPTLSSSAMAACIPANPTEVGKVLDVIDGNTVKVMIKGISYTVRYIGIDVPRYKPVAEYFGQQSDFKNAEFVFAEQVTLIADTQDKDDAGRLLRYVRVGEIFVNYELVRQGYATANSALSACATIFKKAEQEASQSQAGLWKPTPTLPSP